MLPPKITEIVDNPDPNMGPIPNLLDRVRNHPFPGEDYAWVREIEDYPRDPTYEITNIPLEVLEATFTPNEMVRIFQDQKWTASWADEWEKKNPILAKVKSSIWRYGCLSSYRVLVRYFNHLKTLTVRDPGFEVRLTWSSYFNEFGPSVHIRGEKPLFLDGPFGVLIYYRGKHVLTIGIALTRWGVFISQVQLREKKGNRWLYHLDRPYLEWAIQVIADAFQGVKIWLVEGTSNVKAIRASYGKQPCGMTPEAETRISNFYDQSLRDFTRRKEKISCFGRTFIRLRKNKP